MNSGLSNFFPFLFCSAFLGQTHLMEYPLDVAILVSYFGVIGALCWQLRHLFGQAVQSTRPTSYLFLALSAVSFLLTWTFMLQYFLHSYREWVSAQHVISDVGTLDRVSRWLHDVSLFDDAWRFVSSGPWQWLWSHQLCNFTALVWMPFLAFEGKEVLLCCANQYPCSLNSNT